MHSYVHFGNGVLHLLVVENKSCYWHSKGVYWFFESLNLWRQNMYFLPNQIIITAFSSLSENEREERSWLQFPFWITLQKIFSWSNLAQAANRRSYPSHSDTNAADEDLVVKEAFFSVANSINFYLEWTNILLKLCSSNLWKLGWKKSCHFFELVTLAVALIPITDIVGSDIEILEEIKGKSK